MSLPSELAMALSAVPCLKCEKPFRLPDNLAEIESLECPHCHENLLMDDILDELAEELQIPTAAVVKAKQKQVADQPAESDITEPPEIKSHLDEGDYFIPKPLKTAIRRSPHSEADLRRRSKLRGDKRQFTKKTGGPGEWIRIAIGAVLALPVAQLVLWWLFATDPFVLGPRVSRFVPFVVPPKLRHQDANLQETGPAIGRDMPPSQTIHDQIIPLSINSDVGESEK